MLQAVEADETLNNFSPLGVSLADNDNVTNKESLDVAGRVRRPIMDGGEGTDGAELLQFAWERRRRTKVEEVKKGGGRIKRR